MQVLQEIDLHKTFRVLGYNSLFDYAVRRLELSESIAYAFINVSRKAKEVPELKTAIQSGELSVFKARKITSVITPKNAKDWLNKAKVLTQQKLEKEVIKIAPKETTPERVRYVTEERLKLELGVSEDLHRDIKRVQDLLCQRLRRAVTIEETMQYMVSLFLEKNDPVRKAKRVTEKKDPSVSQNKLKSTNQNANHRFLRTVRKPIPTEVKHRVLLRDQGQCTFHYATGERCAQKRWVDFHHILPKVGGGQDSLENLRTLCHHHHRAMHT